MKPWEPVEEIQSLLCGRLDLKHLTDLSKMRFYRKISLLVNYVFCDAV